MRSPAMERLPFVLPDFTRMMWVSDRARDVWAPRLQRITRAWLEIEWRAVVAGVRRCAIRIVSPVGVGSDAARWVVSGLATLARRVQSGGPTPRHLAVGPDRG